MFQHHQVNTNEDQLDHQKFKNLPMAVKQPALGTASNMRNVIVPPFRSTMIHVIPQVSQARIACLEKCNFIKKVGKDLKWKVEERWKCSSAQIPLREFCVQMQEAKQNLFVQPPGRGATAVR